MVSLKEYMKDKKAELKAREEEIKKQVVTCLLLKFFLSDPNIIFGSIEGAGQNQVSFLTVTAQGL